MGLFQKRESDDKKLITEMSDKQRQDKINRLEERRDDVVRRIEKLMFRISKETRMRRLRERKYPLGGSPNDLDFEK